MSRALLALGLAALLRGSFGAAIGGWFGAAACVVVWIIVAPSGAMLR